MKKRGLLFLTLLTILCTSLLMISAGWFSRVHAARQTGHRPDPRSHAKVQVSSLTEAAWRYRRCQPVHWRAMMLQH